MVGSFQGRFSRVYKFSGLFLGDRLLSFIQSGNYLTILCLEFLVLARLIKRILLEFFQCIIFQREADVTWGLGISVIRTGRSWMSGKQNKRFNKDDHRLLVVWASDCATHVLPHFEKVSPEDEKPRKAIGAARAWARGTLTVRGARQAAFASHAAARAVDNPAATAAARAAGHAAATAHVADHARHAADYAVKAAAAVITGDAALTERDWQVRRLPKHLRSFVFPNLRK